MVTARSSIPVLEIEILDLPDRIGHGEEMLIGLRIRNVGGVCAKKLRGIVNRPEMLRLEYERDGGEERKVEKGKRCMKNALSRNEAFDIDLGKNGMLDVGQETIVRMRARGDRVGVVDLKWLFVFEGSVSRCQFLCSAAHVAELASLSHTGPRASVEAGSEEAGSESFAPNRFDAKIF